MATSPLLNFYRGQGTDHARRNLADLHRFDQQQLEAVHDYIQWLFPLPEGSGVNPQAPRLSAVDIAAFHAEPSLRARLRESLILMLEFWGMSLDSGGAVVPSPNFSVRAPNWLTPHNHNYLRITRVIRSIGVLGMDQEAHTLQVAMDRIAEHVGPEVISQETRAYWQRALTGR